MHHLSLVQMLQQHSQPVTTKTPLSFRPGPHICGHALEYSDMHRTVRFDEETLLSFTEVEYKLFLVLVEHSIQHKREATYETISLHVFGCAFYPELLPVLRKRISSIRKKISQLGIDIISVPQRGYELRDLLGLAMPYRRGHRVNAQFQLARQHEAKMFVKE